MKPSARPAALAAFVLVLAGCGAASGPPASPTATTPGPRAASPSAAEDRSASPAASGHTGVMHGSTEPTHAASTSPEPEEDTSAVPSRVVIAGLEIDLPVISGDTLVEGNPPDYPLCNVAQYLTTYRYPGRVDTTTWVYAHARDGMFLPLLDASLVEDGEALVGEEVLLYSTEPRLYRYRIDTVRPHSLTRGIAREVPAGARRLVLQTSEGPRGTVPKLQVGALLVASEPAARAEAVPPAAPEVCYLP